MNNRESFWIFFFTPSQRCAKIFLWYAANIPMANEGNGNCLINFSIILFWFPVCERISYLKSVLLIVSLSSLILELPIIWLPLFWALFLPLHILSFDSLFSLPLFWLLFLPPPPSLSLLSSVPSVPPLSQHCAALQCSVCVGRVCVCPAPKCLQTYRTFFGFAITTSVNGLWL